MEGGERTALPVYQGAVDVEREEFVVCEFGHGGVIGRGWVCKGCLWGLESGGCLEIEDEVAMIPLCMLLCMVFIVDDNFPFGYPYVVAG